MDQLKLLGVALGLACLAGLNLYLTVFLTGLAIHLHWIVLGPEYESLQLLANPIVIWISGALYVLEFFADKVPWVDSAWDTVHTVIRPIGGALLAIRVLGHTTPAFDLAIALAGGGASLVTHAAKASTRLVANTSPEPFSNIGLSLLEDAAVVGGLALIRYNPALALGIFVLFLAIVIYFAPKIFRAVRVKLWLIWKKLNRPADGARVTELPAKLPSRYATAFARESSLGETIAFAVPCIAKRMPGVPANASGVLAVTREDANKLLFFSRSGWHRGARSLNLTGCVAAREAKFLSDNLVIINEGGRGVLALFFFERGHSEWVQQIVDRLNQRPTVAPVEVVPA